MKFREFKKYTRKLLLFHSLFSMTLTGVVKMMSHQLVLGRTCAMNTCIDWTRVSRSTSASRRSSMTSSQCSAQMRWSLASRAGTTQRLRGSTAPGSTSLPYPSTPRCLQMKCPSPRTAFRLQSSPFRTRLTTLTSTALQQSRRRWRRSGRRWWRSTKYDRVARTEALRWPTTWSTVSLEIVLRREPWPIFTSASSVRWLHVQISVNVKSEFI